MTQSLLFVFLPYLKTSEPFRYKSLVFRDIEDTADLTLDAVEHLEVLKQMFFLRDDLRLRHITYTTLFRKNEEESIDKETQQQLYEFQTIIAYLYSAPHKIFGDTFLTKEHASLYLCVPKPIPFSLIEESHLTETVGIIEYTQPNPRGEVDGYEVLLDFRSYLWVVKGSRIYPPVGHLVLNYSQDLYVDLDYRIHGSAQEQLISFISSKPEKSDLSKRILTALEWYNRSNTTDISDDVALVYIAIAFESLLNLEQGKEVTARFREAVSLLLGGLPRLDSWLTQFYNARSDIIHKGRSSNLLFLATDDLKNNPSDRTPKYRSLVSVGRQIFQVCLSTVTYGALTANKLELPSKLFTNQQRLDEICRIISDANRPAAEKLQAVSQNIHDIDNYKFVEETGLRIETLIGSAQLVVKAYLETNPDDDPELLELLNDFAYANREPDYYTALSKLQIIDERNSGLVVDKSVPLSDIFLLLECVWHYSFLHYFWLKKDKDN